MEVTIKLAADKSAEVDRIVDERIIQALTAAGQTIEGYAKLELERNPHRVDTGLLRNSITYALDGESPAIKTYHGDRVSKYKKVEAIPIGRYLGSAPKEKDADARSVRVGTNVEYAIYVHEGATLPSGKKMAPNHFIKNAFTRNIDKIKRLVEQFLKG